MMRGKRERGREIERGGKEKQHKYVQNDQRGRREHAKKELMRKADNRECACSVPLWMAEALSHSGGTWKCAAARRS